MERPNRLDKGIRQAWNRFQKSLKTKDGIPVSISDDMRRLCEEEAWRKIPYIDDEQWLVDFENGLAQCILIHMAARFIESSKGGLNERGAGDSRANKRYSKCFERRLHLVDFVTRETRMMTLDHFLSQSFTPHERIKWLRVCEAWNKAHPHDQRKAPGLHAEFYRCIRDADVQKAFFARMHHQLLVAMAPTFRALERQAAQYADVGTQMEQRAESLAVSRAENPDELAILTSLATGAESQLRDYAKVYATLRQHFKAIESASRVLGNMAEKQAQEEDTTTDSASAAKVEQEKRSQSGRLQRDIPRAKKGKGGS